MKKILTAILCAGLIAVTAAGCGYNDALINNNNETQSSQSSEQTATADEVSAQDYSNDLEGLIKYFIAKGYIPKDEKAETTMDAASIGAKAGKKYLVNYEGKNLTIELYEYDTENLNDTGKATLDSIKKDGTFVVFDLPAVPATLSDNGKFMMIYTDKSIDKENPDKTSANYKHREAVTEDFKAFHK